MTLQEAQEVARRARRKTAMHVTVAGIVSVSISIMMILPEKFAWYVVGAGYVTVALTAWLLTKPFQRLR
jgi:glutamyl-tRNA reductase